MDPNVIRIKPQHYIHVLDNNTNVTRLEVGPKTFTRQDHEQVILEPTKFLMIPPRHYATVSNPIIRNAEGRPATDVHGVFKLRYGDQEIRFNGEPFPLYPGEKLVGNVEPLKVVPPNAALRIRCIRDFKDNQVDRQAGDEWMFLGPATYIPKVEEQVVELVRATILKENQALKLRARRAFYDERSKIHRLAGEEWLYKDHGAYLPGVNEDIVETVKARVLTEKKAVHLRALGTFIDRFERKRRAGEEWLVKLNDSEIHLPDVNEQVVGEVPITSLDSRQYCIVVDPVDPATGKNVLGQWELRKGETSFFLQPGERLLNGIQNVHVLSEDEALLLSAREDFKDVTENKAVERKAGDRWMIYGACDFVPPIEVDILEKRKAIPLDENEGVYVRNISTGKVEMVTAQCYMLKPDEELWEKVLPPGVEELLNKGPRDFEENKAGSKVARDRTRVVTYRVAHNAAVQVYDFKAQRSRVVFGPDLVMLGPDEQFTVLSLSGGKPKQENFIRSLSLMLGPDFMTDIITVETADHARLRLQLAYSWEFVVNKERPSDIFQVPDFVGDACKNIASRIRGVVAGESFDEFHKNSCEIIRRAVFFNNKQLVFKANGLNITDVDVQSVEPVDEETRKSLMRSVQMAIEINMKSREQTAKQQKELAEQCAKGELERQKILDEAAAERERTALLSLQAESAAVESAGQATADAKARARAADIEGEAAVRQAELRAQAMRIKTQQEISQLRLRQVQELEHQKALNELEVFKAESFAKIEAEKFTRQVQALGKDNIKAMASAGASAQAELLKGLGLKGFMITDGNSPINLFNTAKGLLGGR